MKISDILIDIKEPRKSRFTPSSSNLSDIEKVNLVDELISKIQTLGEEDIEYNIQAKGYLFRGHKQNSVRGFYHALRVIPDEIKSLSELKIPIAIVKTLSSESLCSGGLILVSGMTGAGKSTTLSSLLVERLKLFGGTAVTIENPIEAMLAGEHGEGFCIQIPVASELETHEAMRGSLRCFPAKEQQGLLLIGEIRDSYSAIHSLNAALSGHLVLATLHGSNIISTLKRLINLASAEINEVEARSLLAETMRLTIHQRYTNGIHKFSVLANAESNSAVGQHISSGALEKLSTPIQQQANKVLSGEILW